MSSSDSDDGFYSNANVFKNIRIAREQLRKDFESKQENCATKNAKKLLEGSSTENQVNTVKTTENVANNTNDVIFIDSIEDDLILDEIIAKNTKPARGRGRGRKKKDTTIEAPITSEPSNLRGRGRGGKRGRPSKNNVTDTEPSNELNTSVVLNGTRQNGALTSITDDNNSLIEDVLNMITGAGRARGRKRSRTDSPNGHIENILDSVLSSNINGRGRGRQRGRARSSPRGRGRRGQWTWSSIRQPIIPMPPGLSSFNMVSMIPTYSVGNTDEYHDKSDDIPLFSKPTNTNQPNNVMDDAVILENEQTENSDDNELLPVKVIWKSLNVYKFTIRKYQKLTQIFDSFAQKENVGKDKLLFMYNDKIITSDDTPASIDYNIAKFIDGGIVSQSINIVSKKTKVNGIQIKFQCQNRKKPLEITIGKDDKFMLAMRQCAESLDLPMDKLKFEFDGDMVTGISTPQQMGLEDGDCIDVAILS